MAFSRPFLTRLGLILLGFVGLSFILLLLYHGVGPEVLQGVIHAPFDEEVFTPPQSPLSQVRVPCLGPRGVVIAESLDDQVQSRSLDLPLPEPVGGSYQALGLPSTYNTPETRYGAYGYPREGQEDDVQWGSVDWARLQNDCLALNWNRFHSFDNVSTSSRFHLLNRGKLQHAALEARPPLNGRSAIVLRSWEDYNYTSLFLNHIRSLIVEAGLNAEADAAVFLLVDVKDKDETRHIFSSAANYDKALDELVPREFRNMTVLFDKQLLKSWYPRVAEHSAFFQIYQPLQLFAQLFPGFDHYWQLEMDMKFTGDSRLWLDAMASFARKEPRKQSVERSSYYYMPQIHGSWEDFTVSINASLQGGGIWGPIRIPDIEHPIGPEPPTASPLDDDFTWGVGEEADLILTNALADVQAAKYWPFKEWIHGFQGGVNTTRFYSPVAMGRCSWNLLNTMHHAQVQQGLSLPSEASAVSFALYHGLKVVFPPNPWFHHPQAPREVDVEELDQLFNGGTPAENAQSNRGLSFGKAMYDPQGSYKLFNGGTWWWVRGYPGRIFGKWMRNEQNDLPDMLREVDGHVWAPLLALHPVKLPDIT